MQALNQSFILSVGRGAIFLNKGVVDAFYWAKVAAK